MGYLTPTSRSEVLCSVLIKVLYGLTLIFILLLLSSISAGAETPRPPALTPEQQQAFKSFQQSQTLPSTMPPLVTPQGPQQVLPSPVPAMPTIPPTIVTTPIPGANKDGVTRDPTTTTTAPLITTTTMVTNEQKPLDGGKQRGMLATSLMGGLSAMLGGFFDFIGKMLGRLAGLLLLALIAYLFIRWLLGRIASGGLFGSVPGLAFLAGAGVWFMSGGRHLLVAAVVFLGLWFLLRRTKGGKKVSRGARKADAWWRTTGAAETKGRFTPADHSGAADVVELVDRYPARGARPSKATICCPPSASDREKMAVLPGARKWRMAPHSIMPTTCPYDPAKKHEDWKVKV